MEELDKLCGELDINLSILQDLTDKDKKKLYDVLQNDTIIQKACEVGIIKDGLIRRLLTDNPKIGGTPLHIKEEKIINQLERIALGY